jgi:CRP-like cAMP-binding protein
MIRREARRHRAKSTLIRLRKTLSVQGRKAAPESSIEVLLMKELLTNKILTSLPAEDFMRLLPHLEPVSLRSGQALDKFGDQIHFSYFPESAVISHLHIWEDGRTTEAAMIGKEGMTGLSVIFGSHPPARWTQITIGGSALKIRIEIIREEFVRNRALQQLILGYAGARINQLSQRAACNGRHTMEERLCSWLLMVRDRAGEDRMFLTQERIAYHLGTRRESVTSIANTLRDKQIISYNRGQFQILNREALEGVSCECYRTLGQSAAQIGNNQ